MARAFDWDLDDTITNDGFTDTPAWCKPVTKYAKDEGIIEGRSEGVLGMDTPLSRYEWVVILYRTLKGSAPATKADYHDFIVDWAQDATDWAKAMGYMTGFSNGMFGGTQGILKQDLGIVLLRIVLAQ